MLRLALALAATTMIAAPVSAAPCKDARGKITKCPPAAKAGPAKRGITKDKKAKCHVAAGKTKGRTCS